MTKYYKKCVTIQTPLEFDNQNRRAVLRMYEEGG